MKMTFYKEFHSPVNMPCGKTMKNQLLPSLKRAISAYVLDENPLNSKDLLKYLYMILWFSGGSMLKPI